jgi:FHA domain
MSGNFSIGEAMSIKLNIRSTEDSLTQELLCEQQLITFGRSKSCTVMLDQAGVSRRHFIIRFSEGKYIIIDEGSTAGTILDGTQLDSKNCYELGPTHEIVVPGFIINLENDNKAPRQERTTVMARKLMDKIFDNANDTDHVPRLTHSSKNPIFYFHDDKASFVLGTLAHSDFVVHDDGHFSKEHVSFIRDISGVRIIPIIGANTFLNERQITEPEILNHNDKIIVGITMFIYQDYQDDAALIFETTVPKASTTEPLEEPLLGPAKVILPKSTKILKNLDRLCFGLFFISIAGVFWIITRIVF